MKPLKANVLLGHNDLAMDDYAKDGGPGVVWHLCSFYRDPLRSSIVIEV